MSGYWGEQGFFGRYWNYQAMRVGSGRIISTYATTHGDVLRVITEMAGEVTIIWHEEDR